MLIFITNVHIWRFVGLHTLVGWRVFEQKRTSIAPAPSETKGMCVLLVRFSLTTLLSAHAHTLFPILLLLF